MTKTNLIPKLYKFLITFMEYNGINFRSNKKLQCHLLRGSTICGFLMNVAFLFITAQHVAAGIQDLLGAAYASMLFSNISCMVFWHALYRHELSSGILFHAVNRSIQKFEKKDLRGIWVCGLTSTVITILVPVLTLLSRAVSLDSIGRQRLLKYYLLSTDVKLTDEMTIPVAFFFEIVNHWTAFFLTNMFSVLYMFQAMVLRRMLLNCKMTASKYSYQRTMSAAKLRTLYDQCCKLTSLMEHSYSLPIFVLLAIDFLGMFAGLAICIRLIKLVNHEFKIFMFSFVGMRFGSFLAVTVSAAEVHTADRSLRKTVNAMMATMKEGDQMKDPLAATYAREPLVLTAWSIFELDRQFVLSGCGALLTYGLLFLQLKTNDTTT